MTVTYLLTCVYCNKKFEYEDVRRPDKSFCPAPRNCYRKHLNEKQNKRRAEGRKGRVERRGQSYLEILADSMGITVKEAARWNTRYKNAYKSLAVR